MRVSPTLAPVAAVLIGTGAGYAAYLAAGWIGVGVLGLLLAFVAVQVDMDQAAPIGGQQTGSLYASTIQAQERMGRAEKAARHSERQSTLRVVNVVKVVGGVLAMAGLLGFFFLQLPH